MDHIVASGIPAKDHFVSANTLTCDLLLNIQDPPARVMVVSKLSVMFEPLCRTRMEKEDLNPDNMIKPEDVCELVLLPFKISPNAVPQEIVLDAMTNPSA